MRFLIADDNLEFAKTLELALEPLGECEIFPDGAEAFKGFCRAFKDGRLFDLLFIDIMMPARDGFETIELIQFFSEILEVDVPIVLMTGFDATEFREKAAKVGVEHFFPKQNGLSRFVEVAKEYQTPEAP